jgi:hypothetical protein
MALIYIYIYIKRGVIKMIKPKIHFKGKSAKANYIQNVFIALHSPLEGL